MRPHAKTLQDPAAPRVFRRALSHGRRELVVPALAMDQSSALKVAWWRGSVVAEPSLPCHDFVSLFLHLKGSPVRRMDGVREWAAPGNIVAPGVFEAEAWESEGEFEWCQFYISRRLFDEVAGERFSEPAAKAITEMRSVTLSPAVSRLALQARNELFDGPASALQRDAWGLILADAWLRDAARRQEFTVEKQKPKGPWRSKPVMEAMSYVERNLDRNITLEEMAIAAGVSRFHLVRLFREFVGQSPAAFARTRRVERSKALLRSSDQSISEIALLCGFADQSHFSTVFSRSTGVPPGVFRRRSS